MNRTYSHSSSHRILIGVQLGYTYTTVALENSREIGILIFEVFNIYKYFRNVNEKNKLLCC